MEHFGEPETILQEMVSMLKPGGQLFIVFGPPWYAPYGSHTQYFTRMPWINIIFSEKTIMSVRSRFRDDGAKRFTDVEGGLNKMSVAKFNRIIKGCGMKVDYIRYDCVKGMNFLGRLPVVKELFINQIACVLSKA